MGYRDIPTVRGIEALKPHDKPCNVADAGGLHVLVSTTGARLFQLKYRFAGMERQLALGEFPATSGVKVREVREAAKAVPREGRDPGARMVAAPATPTLAEVAADLTRAEQGRLDGAARGGRAQQPATARTAGTRRAAHRPDRRAGGPGHPAHRRL